MKKLLVLFTSPIRGGAENYALTVASAAAESDWNAHVAFSGRPELQELAREFSQAGVTYHPANIVDVGSYETIDSNWSRILSAWTLIRAISPDVILLVLCGIQYGLSPMIASALAGVPICVVYQLVREDTHMRLGSQRIRKLLRLRRQTYVAVSKANQRILSQKFDLDCSSIHVVANGVSTSRFLKTAIERVRMRERIREELGVPIDSKILLTIGRLAEQKGHDVLIPAIPHILARHSNTHFLWAGEGPTRKMLEAALTTYGVRKYVTFLGWTRDIPDLMAGSDILIHPTRFEGQPFSLIEAMAAKLPIVTTNASGIGEVFTDHKHALICEVDDIRDIRQNVLWALDNPCAMEELAENAFRDRLPEYTEEQMVKKTLQILTSISS
ncbi:MAG: glycosyltransferase family 4 protein [Candidatus Omnitrophica bacterium]|nr:glycosyltransferase family 4 protein [Candidatus Omnitrophota bacterium]